jgi:Zn-dependent peptidase ImmA (M78 family)
LTYEDLLSECEKNDIKVVERYLSDYDGLIIKNIIVIRKELTQVEKKCVLAEELGHFYMTTGNILDYNNMDNRRQEKTARNWAVDKLLDCNQTTDTYLKNNCNLYDTAEELEVTPQFLEYALKHFIEKHGLKYYIEKYKKYYRQGNIVYSI